MMNSRSLTPLQSSILQDMAVRCPDLLSTALLEKMTEARALCRITSHQKEIKYEVIFGAYDRFSKFIQFSPGSIRDDLYEYLYPVFVHLCMQLIRMKKIYHVHQFSSRYSNQFCRDPSKLQGLTDLVQFKSYEDAARHHYLHQFGFRNQKYVIRLTRSNHEILTTWLKQAKSTLVKDIIALNILSVTTEGSSYLEKYSVLRFDEKGSERREAEARDLRMRKAVSLLREFAACTEDDKECSLLDHNYAKCEEPETSDSDSFPSTDGSASKSYEEPCDDVSHNEAMKGFNSLGLGMNSIDPEKFQNDPECCDYLYSSAMSANKVMTDVNRKHSKTVKHLGNTASSSSTRQQNSSSVLSCGSFDMHDMHKPHCPRTTVIFMEPKPQSSFSSAKSLNTPVLKSKSPKFPSSGSSDVVKQKTQSRKSSSGKKLANLLSSGSNEDVVDEQSFPGYLTFNPKQKAQPSVTSRKNVSYFLSSGSDVARKQVKPYCLEHSASAKRNLQSHSFLIADRISRIPSSHFPTGSSKPTVPSCSHQCAESSGKRRNAGSHRRRRNKSSRVVPEVCLLTVRECSKALACAVMAREGTYIFGGFSNGIYGWNLQNKIYDRVTQNCDQDLICGQDCQSAENTIIFNGHSGVVNGVSYNGKEDLLISGSEDKKVKVWRLSDQECLQDYDIHLGAVIDVCSSTEVGYFASASADYTAALWNYNRNVPILRYSEHEGEVTCIKCHPNSYYIATASDDETVKLWSVNNAKSVRLFHGHEEKVTALDFSPCGSYLASADMNGYIKIWDIKSGQTLNSFFAHERTITSIAYNPTGTFIGIGGFGGSIRIFDTQKLGTAVSELQDEAEFLAAMDNNFRGYHHKYPFDLATDCKYDDRDVFSVNFTNRNLLVGIAGYGM